MSATFLACDGRAHGGGVSIDTDVRAGHGTGRGHAAEEYSGKKRWYCDSELHLGLEKIWCMVSEEEE